MSETSTIKVPGAHLNSGWAIFSEDSDYLDAEAFINCTDGSEYRVTLSLDRESGEVGSECWTRAAGPDHSFDEDIRRSAVPATVRGVFDEIRTVAEVMLEIRAEELNEDDDAPAPPVTKFDVTPTWRALLPLLVEVAVNGDNEAARGAAWAELYRLADRVDKLNEEEGDV